MRVLLDAKFKGWTEQATQEQLEKFRTYVEDETALFLTVEGDKAYLPFTEDEFIEPGVPIDLPKVFIEFFPNLKKDRLGLRIIKQIIDQRDWLCMDESVELDRVLELGRANEKKLRPQD